MQETGTLFLRLLPGCTFAAVVLSCRTRKYPKKRRGLTGPRTPGFVAGGAYRFLVQASKSWSFSLWCPSGKSLLRVNDPVSRSEIFGPVGPEKAVIRHPACRMNGRDLALCRVTATSYTPSLSALWLQRIHRILCLTRRAPAAGRYLVPQRCRKNAPSPFTVPPAYIGFPASLPRNPCVPRM